MRIRLFSVFSGTLALLLALPARAQCDWQPPFELYRSFTKEPGVKNRCFFASNILNGLAQPYCEYPPIWVGEGKCEFEHFDAQMEEMISSNPGRKLFCMVDLDSPFWMIRRFRFDVFSDISTASTNPNWVKMTLQILQDRIRLSGYEIV